MKRFHLNTLVALAALLPAAAWAQTYTAGPGLALAIPDNGYNGTQGSMGCSTIAVGSGGGGGDTVATATVQVAQSLTFEKRVYPAINVNRSGTRREELLLMPAVLRKMWVLRKLLYNMDDMEATEFLLDKVKATKNNGEFFDAMRQR